jgi:hypothetical protein
MSREFRYTGRFREGPAPIDIGPPPPYSGPLPDKSKAFDVVCPECHGRGDTGSDSSGPFVCQTCGGIGGLSVQQELARCTCGPMSGPRDCPVHGEAARRAQQP